MRATLVGPGRWLSWLALLVLAGCAHQAPLPEQLPTLKLPLQLHVQRVEGQDRQDQLLVIQAEGVSLRWTLLDPLGVPQARQVLEDADWDAEGLLPPNPAAQELFAAVLFALTPETQLADRYRGDDWRIEDGERVMFDGDRSRWRVRYLSNGAFELDSLNGLTYRVAPLAPRDGGREQ